MDDPTSITAEAMYDLAETQVDPVADVPVVVPSPSPSPSPPAPGDRTLELFGVRITDVSRGRAVELLLDMIAHRDGHTRSVFFVNAHSLNLVHRDEDYRRVLAGADYVFADGTGVRWAARFKGVRLRDNVNGTDLMPELLGAPPTAGRRYFLLGGDEETIRRAAEHARRSFPGWQLAGYHHGYVVDPQSSSEVIRTIHAARPDMLLVGMGNPLQEKWITRYRGELGVPLCIGVGGLFDFWAERFGRAPLWLRKLGHEWIWRLLQDPKSKACRYLIGNPLFLWRAFRQCRYSPQGGPSL